MTIRSDDHSVFAAGDAGAAARARANGIASVQILTADRDLRRSFPANGNLTACLGQFPWAGLCERRCAAQQGKHQTNFRRSGYPITNHGLFQFTTFNDEPG